MTDRPGDLPLMPGLLQRPVDDLMAHLERRALSTSWRDVQMIKSPVDAWVLQELVTELRPAFVVEIGCYRGGTSLFLGDVMEALGHGRVITIDHRPELIDRQVWGHRRITVLEGFALDLVDEVRAAIADAGPVLVIEDSNHAAEHTLAICRTFGELVSPRSYLIVEDTHYRRNLAADEEPGPAIAVRQFLAEDDRFVADRTRESFGLTFNPGGYLRRIR